LKPSMRRACGIACVIVMILLSSCATTPAQRQPKTPVATAPPATQAPAPRSESARQPAVVALLDEADRYDALGQRDQAAASLERALRIQPRDATLWHRLAKIRLEQGQLQQAQTLAARSNALAGNDRRLIAANWHLIADVKTKLGDPEGAARARQNAKQFGTF
jgi:tetratricopeptide (TPR) repeat protein